MAFSSQSISMDEAIDLINIVKKEDFPTVAIPYEEEGELTNY
jgi:hypothetical protein